MSERTNLEYLQWDPFDGDKDGSGLKCRTVAIVTTRKPHMCLCENTHEIPKGTRVRRERGIYYNEWKSWYVCLDCIDKELDAPHA